MNLPNVLTVARMVLAVFLVFLLEQESEIATIAAVFVFTAASLTDFYDGYFARKNGIISDFGKIMDPIADKLLLLSSFGVLAHLGLVAWWMFVVVAAREITITVSRLLAMRRGQVLAAERAGKVKTVVQITAVSVMLLYLVAAQSELYATWFYHVQGLWNALNYVLMLAVVVLTVYSGIEYFYRRSKI